MIDYNFLAESNELSQKWADKAKISKNGFMKFITNVCADPMAFAATLTPKNKKEFIADLERMFYAAKHETELIIQFRPAVFHLIRRFKINDDDCLDDLISTGHQSLRVSIWRYRMPHIKIATYVFNGIINCYRGELSRLQKLKRNAKVIVNSKINESVTKLIVIDKKSHEPHEIVESNQLIEFLESKAFTAEEKEILKFFMTRNCSAGFNWCTIYQNYKKSKKEKTVHRTVLQRKIVIIKRKIARHLHSIDADKYELLYNMTMKAKL